MAYERLEPYAEKFSRTALRRATTGNSRRLSAHVLQLKTLLTNIRGNSNSKDAIKTIKDLISSGNIGSMGGNGTLRKALMEITSTACKGNPLAIDNVLSHITKMNAKKAK